MTPPRPKSSRDLPPAPLCFEAPTLLLYRVFDVASEIDIDKAQALLAGAGTRLKLSRERSEYLEIPRAPLTVHLGRRELVGKSGKTYTADAYARLFSFGAVSIRYELSIGPPADSSLAARFVHEFEANREIEAAARTEAMKLAERLKTALDGPHAWGGVETYAVLFARGLDGVRPAASVETDSRIAKILLAEAVDEELGPEEVRDATQHHFSYAENDLCVLDWNAAVVVEPDGSRDIPDVLEFATAQLLEFRYYDDIFDREAEGLYDILVKRREPLLWKYGGRYRRITRLLNRRLLETIEFMERVDNALKVVADTYLARIYQAAMQCFRVPAWQAGLNHKQELTRQVAEVLAGESQAFTSHLLELIVILLILYEIVAPLLTNLTRH